MSHAHLADKSARAPALPAHAVPPQVSSARAKGVRLMSLKDVADGLHSGVGLIEGGAGSPDMVITEYSAGYNENGIALRIGAPVAPSAYLDF